ncbi:MAG: ABC transporter permease [Erysipelotrichaceae bacterium]|jgi:spermidine/putrescine transport system permease protein|nr:ABC transporter permease [Erysipelotrichaceae bacterium]
MKGFRSLVRPYIVFGFIFIVIPMVLIVLYAFTKSGNSVLTFQFTFDNFKKFFDPVFVKVLGKSLEIAIMTTVICVLIGYPIAYAISKLKENTQTFLIVVITVPMWINMLVRTYAWISLISDNGIINSILVAIGLSPVKIMYTDFAVTLGMVYNFLPFMILQIHSSLTRMDYSLIEASYDLGANRTQTFRKVVFPLSLSGVISGITLVFLPAVSTFVIPKLLGGGSYVLIGNLIENQFITVGEWNFGSAISLIMAVIIMISMWVTRKFDQDPEANREVVNNGGV